MNKREYTRAKELIIKEYGIAEYEQNVPVNESAKRLVELRKAYLANKKEIEKTKALAEEIQKIAPRDIKAVPIPERLINTAWLVSFTDTQKAIINQWLLNTEQTSKEIAVAVGSTVQAVNATMSLEAFNILRLRLSVAWMDSLPLKAAKAVDDLLGCDVPNTKFNAAKMTLLHAGIIKQDSIDNTTKNEAALDPETLERLRKLGDQLL